MNYKKVVETLRIEMRNYIVDNHLRSLVLGISGGVDSALVSALVKPVCDELDIPLIGRSITIQSNKADEIERAKMIGDMFCTHFSEVNLTTHFNVMHDIDEKIISASDDNIAYKIRMGNIKARMRMIYLYNLASKHNGLVLSTDNLTEYYLGFWTIAGDIGDFSLIQELWKTEVYDMSEWIAGNECDDAQEFALMSCVHADATDGLGISNTDLDQILPDWRLRHTTTRSGYNEVDNIFKEYFNNNFKFKDSPVIKRYFNTQFKRNIPIVVKREKIM